MTRMVFFLAVFLASLFAVSFGVVELAGLIGLIDLSYKAPTC